MADCPLIEGSRVKVSIPKDTALGALHDDEGASRRRTVRVVDGRLLLLDFTWAGQHEVPREWVRDLTA